MYVVCVCGLRSENLPLNVRSSLNSQNYPEDLDLSESEFPHLLTEESKLRLF